MRRAERLWDRWDAAVRSGAKPADILPTLTDEEVIGLLAAGSPERRRYELDLLMTEAHNRLARLRLGTAQGGGTPKPDASRAKL